MTVTRNAVERAVSELRHRPATAVLRHINRQTLDNWNFDQQHTHPRAAAAACLRIARFKIAYYGSHAFSQARPYLADAAIWRRQAALLHPLP